ncbi:hypothetical protein PybrP1_002909 [[Pythium] brassicae (nom. inval.)]|nr:hypothetical protein PybrP1_002909 [[Pythium] brassicae (nom. inval.)]
MSDAVDTPEYAAQAEAFKAEGNRLLSAQQFAEAAEMYSRAIALDPDNAVYFSNRSAAYLAMGDARGKALRDAERCIELRPEWWKGYSRKGAAEHALLRFDAARATYNRGLALDPDNASLLQAAEDAYAAGQAHSQRLREQAREAEKLKAEQAATAELAAAALKQQEADAQRQQATTAAPDDTDDALLAQFMSEVQEIEESTNCVKKPDVDEAAKEKAPVDFGTSEGQLARLLQPHFKWINLNPFRVLMLDTDATEEDMKQHYRKISTLVHPDKFRDPRAREAFEEVTKAYNLILQEDRRKVCVRVITNSREKVAKDRRLRLKKGAKESELGDLQDEEEKEVLRAFAEIENRRLNIERREAAQRKREAEQQEKEEREVVDMFKRERAWAEQDRREHRVGNWRGFVKDGKRRKEMDAHGWKEEQRDDKKFGVAENDAYKKRWK